MGLRKNVEEQLNAETAEMNREIQEAQLKFEAEYNKLKALVGEDASVSQAAQLTKIEGDLNQKFATLQNEAKEKLAARQQELINEVLAQLKPVALEVAESKGIGIILTPSQVFHWAESLDITEEVIAILSNASLSGPVPTTSE